MTHQDPSSSSLATKLEDVERLRRASDFSTALERLDRIIQAHPKSIRALNERGLCLRLTGNPSRAVVDFRKARKLAPESAEVLANLADCLRDMGDLETALRAYKRAVELKPDFAPVHAEVGATCQALGKPKSAVAAYKRSLGLNPSHPQCQANLGAALLEVGDAEAALVAADRALELDGRSRRAMVVKSFALHEVGRTDEAAALFNLDFVRPFPTERVEGFESVAEFSRELSRHVTEHPSLEYEPANRSTTKGEQTGELLFEPKGPVAHLEGLIRSAIGTFLDDLPKDSSHPYLKHRPRLFRLNLWGTRLGSQGHQSPHIHPGAWVSGVYYAQLPEEMSSEGGDQAGWIEFGGAPRECKLVRERPVRLIAPQEGTLVLFPSYYYHRTLPFTSDTRRISIAFDAIPSG